MTEYASNGATSTLAATIIAGATSLTIQAGDTAAFPSSGTFPLHIFDAVNGDEIVEVGTVSGATFGSLTRASEAYAGVQTAVAHGAGCVVALEPTAGTIAPLVAASGLLVPTTGGTMTGPLLAPIEDTGGQLYNLVAAGAASLGADVSWSCAWSSTAAYIVGQVVYSGSTYYLCASANTNEVPPNVLYWTAIAPPDTTSIIQSEGTTTIDYGGGTVFVPHGAYLVDGNLAWSGSSTQAARFNLEGDGPKQSVLFSPTAGSGTLLTLNPSANLSKAGRIGGLTLDVSAAPGMTALSLSALDGGYVHDLETRGGAIGILETGLNVNATLERVYVNNAVVGIELAQGAGTGNSIIQIRDTYAGVTSLATATMEYALLIQGADAGILLNNFQALAPTSGSFSMTTGIAALNPAANTGTLGQFLFIENSIVNGVTGAALVLQNTRQAQVANSFFGSGIVAASSYSAGAFIDGGVNQMFVNDWFTGSGIEIHGRSAAANWLQFANSQISQTASRTIAATATNGSTALVDTGNTLTFADNNAHITGTGIPTGTYLTVTGAGAGTLTKAFTGSTGAVTATLARPAIVLPPVTNNRTITATISYSSGSSTINDSGNSFTYLDVGSGISDGAGIPAMAVITAAAGSSCTIGDGYGNALTTTALVSGGTAVVQDLAPTNLALTGLYAIGQGVGQAGLSNNPARLVGAAPAIGAGPVYMGGVWLTDNTNGFHGFTLLNPTTGKTKTLIVSNSATGTFEIMSNGGSGILQLTDAGTLIIADGITVTTGGLTVTAGGLTVTAGGLTVTAGTVSLPAGSVATAALAVTPPVLDGTVGDIKGLAAPGAVAAVGSAGQAADASHLHISETLAYGQWAPSGQLNVTATSTTWVVVPTTDVTMTFTAPTSGAVRVRVNGTAKTASANDNALLSISASATVWGIVSGSYVSCISSASSATPFGAVFNVAGLIAGNSYTWYLWVASGGAYNSYVYGQGQVVAGLYYSPLNWEVLAG
jgi:hypothetical protein